MAISPQDGGTAAEAAKRPALKAVETVPEGAAPSVETPRKRPEAPKAVPAGKRSAPPRTLVRLRHYAGLASFLLLVLLPLAATVYYLYVRAEDAYHSDVSFSVRSEEPGAAAAGILGAITGIGGGGTASEPDILFEYIRSQEIVAAVSRDIDLRAIYNREPDDVVFALGEESSIEDLVRHWNRVVDVTYDNHSGIIRVRATAFTPEDARTITRAILEKSTMLVNHLAEQSRTDAIRFAKVDLDEAEAHLRDLRQKLASFRRENRMVDPQADVEGQMGLLTALQEELAKALVERDMLLTYAEPADQRVKQAERRIIAISDRIEDERANLGVPDAAASGPGGAMPEVVGDFEALKVDLEFASQAYTQALANLTLARAEARRQSRYLAAHVEPTLAESSLYPRRAMLSGLTGLFLLLGWGVLMLVYYNVRDNR
jgi:capsular polysaccharide transport system permease protein